MSEQDQDKAAKRAQWEEINRAKALARQQDKDGADQAKAAPAAPRKQFQAIKGTRDLLPPDTALWNHVEQTAREVFATFNFGEIRPPIFEPTELFARAVGDDTDIVGKEMYTFTPASDRVELSPNMGALGARLDNIKRLFDAGEIPKTPFNKRAIEDAQKTWREIESLAPSENKIPKLDRLVVLIESMKLGDSISLRPEATASVCRAYIEHSMQQLPQPVRLYYIGPMFRRERPQKGRYRQFYQIGAEVLGGQDAPAIDAELIDMLMTFFDELELKGLELDINSIGHNAPNCRPAYVALLKQELEKVKDKLGEDSRRRIDTNPLRVLDSKLDFEQPVIATLPKIADHLCAECQSHYAAVKNQLQLRGIFYRENWRLVRGLDYYMRTTFEITAKGLGSQNAVCGGGRYDGLVELLGGPPTKGIGFAIGEDRLILSLQEQAREGASEASALATNLQSLDLFIAWMGHNTYATAVRAAKDLRNAGFSVEVPPTELKFGKALGQADKLGAKFALILGENEVSEGLWTLKTLSDGAQVKLTEPDLIAHLRQNL
ncbi:MAG TPA: histidine--tRNA ligase [Candidatus Acidoferrum sp.]